MSTRLTDMSGVVVFTGRSAGGATGGVLAPVSATRRRNRPCPYCGRRCQGAACFQHRDLVDAERAAVAYDLDAEARRLEAAAPPTPERAV